MDSCQARPGADGQVRCERCRLVWDRDDRDLPLCPNRETAQHRIDAMAYAAEAMKPRIIGVDWGSKPSFVSGLPDPVRR